MRKCLRKYTISQVLVQVRRCASTCESAQYLQKCAILAQVRKRASACASAQLRKCVSPQKPALRKCVDGVQLRQYAST